LIPVIAISQKKLDLAIKGGTDVLWSPSIDYIQHVLGEAYSRMGIKFSIGLSKRGYYPKGGGYVQLQVHPHNIKAILFSKNIKAILFSKRKTSNVKLICSFSKLPIEKIKKEIEEIKKKLTDANFIVDIEIKNEEAMNSGASVLIYSIDENSIIGIDGLFDKKRQKFDLDVEKFIKSSSIDENLADMLVVPASLGNGKTIFQVREISKHLETNLFVTSKITGCKYGIGKTSNGFEVIIEGISNPSIK
jgi:RNA 3'-terminal phosphate cyclase (ATP)